MPTRRLPKSTPTDQPRSAALPDRLAAAAAAKKALLARFLAKPDPHDPAELERQATLKAIAEARDQRQAERRAAKAAEAARLAAEAAAKAAEERRQAAEAVRQARALEAERKAARDARYAARKARR